MSVEKEEEKIIDIPEEEDDSVDPDIASIYDEEVEDEPMFEIDDENLL